MPARDGRGPIGQSFSNLNGASAGVGRGQMGGVGAGPGGDCVCPKCGAKVPHQVGVPCTSVTCPKCNAIMIRGE